LKWKFIKDLEMNRKDIFLSAVIGFLVGILALPIISNLKPNILTIYLSIGIILGFTILSITALWATFLLGKIRPVFFQFGKFAAVGTLNTVLDIGILNLLLFLVGVSAGGYFSLFKGTSFLLASTNSYFWNKFWAFQSNLPVTAGEYTRFIIFTFIGLLINVGVASLVVSISPLNGLSASLWANIAALVAVIASLIWNFISYRYFVFR